MAKQLDLTLSLTDAAALQQELALSAACAEDEHERAEALAEECARLREALAAAEARALAMEREAIEQRTLAEFSQRLLAMLRTGRPAQSSGTTPSKEVLTWMLTVIHSDKHHGSPDERHAHQATIFVNDLRSRLGVV